jgi:hypothetical protein
LAENTQAILPAPSAATNSDGKGELKICSKVNEGCDWANGILSKNTNAMAPHERYLFCRIMLGNISHALSISKPKPCGCCAAALEVISQITTAQTQAREISRQEHYSAESPPVNFAESLTHNMTPFCAEG